MKTRALATMLLPLGFLAACGGDPEPAAEVTVEMSDWSGWSPDYEPQVKVVTHAVAAGDTFELDPTFGGPETVTVEEIDEDSVTLLFDAPLSPRNDGRINMNMNVWAPTITEGRATELATATLDAGMNYTITVEITE